MISNSTALATGPSVFDYVSFIWKINMMGIPLEIPIDTTGSDSDIERRMAYWREDLGVNGYHWHWHVVHPFNGPNLDVKNDRRGELFYYLHQQIIARYNVERICNGLNLVQPMLNWDEPIPEPYYPILNEYIASKNYPNRLARMKLSNVNRPDLGFQFNIQDLMHYRERIFEAINRKTVIASNGSKISIDNDQGIDILGNMVEASRLSPNQHYYGNIHNNGHIAIAVIHDPENKYNQSAGVMFKPNTAMRDPLFYRWHAFLNSFFQEHKASLQTYNEKILSFPGIQISNIELNSYKNGNYRHEKNTLYTYMMKSDVNMSQGLDFVSGDAVYIRMTHQNHDEFDYIIECINNSQRQLLGTIRIFLLPVVGFHNYPMKLSEQRSMAIEMDRFVQPLEPGINKIVRRSTMSSVTIPYEQTFSNLDINRLEIDYYQEINKFHFCGCGWPQHLLVPRGTAEGYPMLLFAMITDSKIDRTNLYRDLTQNHYECKPSESICGLRDKKYPDKRPVGFPFDRPINNDIDKITAFLTPNMAIKPINIFHSSEVREGRFLSKAAPVILNIDENNTLD